MHSRNYGLDLARCLAVGMVWIMHSIQEIYHTAVPYFWYISLGGVELFFSLSGFLIGRILLSLFLNPQFRPRDIPVFWMRRWLRILPLYFVMYFAYLLLYNLYIYPVRFDISYLLFLQNIRSTPTFFGESWSLSIEEWFYLCVPVIILFFYYIASLISRKRRAEIAFLSTAFGLILLMIVFRQASAGSGINHQAVIFRMDAIAYGLIAAYVSMRIPHLSNRRAVQTIIGGLALWLAAAILMLSPLIDAHTKPLYYPMCGIGSAALVLGLYYYSFKRRILFVTYTSKISYSIYLIHLSGVLIPLSIATLGLSAPILFVVWLISFPFIWILSLLSFKFIELPFLSLRSKLTWKKEPGR
ncbi:MAG TPA: acyltransferase [Flavitalea sp.]|nr:acyltransferase [Flavitalea sp.]